MQILTKIEKTHTFINVLSKLRTASDHTTATRKFRWSFSKNYKNQDYNSKKDQREMTKKNINNLLLSFFTFKNFELPHPPVFQKMLFLRMIKKKFCKNNVSAIWLLQLGTIWKFFFQENFRNNPLNTFTFSILNWKVKEQIYYISPQHYVNPLWRIHLYLFQMSLNLNT